MKRFCWLIGLCWIIFLTIGCATREDVVILDRQNASMERQLNAIRESNEGINARLAQRIEQAEKRMDSLLQPVHQNQADITAQIEALKIQIQTLQGRIEAFEYNQKREQNRLGESLVKEMRELQTRLHRLEQPPPPPPPPPASTSPAEPGAKVEKPPEINRDSKNDQKEVKEPAKEKEKPKATADDLYEEAGVLFKKQAFDGAQKKYEEYLKTAPKGKYAEEARFGSAESLMGKKEYEEAILTYQKLIKSYPKSKYVPEALYKQALAFISLKDTSSARLLLEKIVKNYPKTGQAKLAQKKLKSL